ncbi:YeiH family protein [Roseateles paludis]|uniref:Sulfate exporter family transporter n=1 Tax=Roseateles paludis TaxID=3145238 RepID=A0ABV0FX04_9BURK
MQDPPLPLSAPAAPATPRWWLACQARWSGLLLCIVIGLAAAFVSKAHGGPQLLYALLFGVSLHFLHEDPRIAPGLALCSGLLLRLGVALLGVRITFGQMVGLGLGTVLAVAGSVVATLGFGLWLARRLGLSPAQGVLSGGATAICGASAALAIAAVLPRSREQERFTVLVVMLVTALSTLAMLAYPVVAHALDLSPRQSGIFFGAAIHDVAQVVASGYLLGTQAGDTATLVKLLRVASLAGVVAVVSLAWRQGPQAGAVRGGALRTVPWFLWVFFGLVGLQSLWPMPVAVATAATELSRDCITLAIAALGVRTSMQALVHSGWRPVLLMVAETVWLAGLVLAWVLLGTAR